ncbi:MAG: ABC transporter ATP-binding protein [Simkaniaceae bacterium]
MLLVKDLYYNFPDRPLLRGISFHLNKGETAALIGRSGSGKTTLMKIIAEILPSHGGNIFINGFEERRSSQITYLMQEDLLLPWRTALQNALLFREFQTKMTHFRQHKEALALFHYMGLGGLQDHFPSQLSGGQRKKTALARALLSRRPLLILDEPFASIDCLAKEQMYPLIRAMQVQYGITILFITHDFSEAAALADRALFFIEGKIAREIEPKAGGFHERDLKTAFQEAHENAPI